MYGYYVDLELDLSYDILPIAEGWTFYDEKEYKNYPPFISDQNVKEIKNQTIRLVNDLIAEYFYL